MKIGIHIGSAFLSQKTGVEEYTNKLIHHLLNIKKKDDEFTFFCNPKTNDLLEKYKNKYSDKAEFRIINFPFLWTKVALQKEILKNHYDLLFFPANFPPFFIPDKTKVFSVIHGLEFKNHKDKYPFWDSILLDLGTKLALKKSDILVAVSQKTKDDILKFYPSVGKKIYVIHHGVDEKYFTLKTPKSHINYFLYIGRIEEKKNIKNMLFAFNNFWQKNRDFHFILIGKDGYKSDEIKKVADILSSKKHIHFLGYASEKRKEFLLNNAKALFFASYDEGFGMPVLEAQAAGIPVVLSDLKVFHEVAGNYAFYANPLNIDSLKKALEESLKAKESFIKNAREHAKKFSWKECAKKVYNLMKK